MFTNLPSNATTALDWSWEHYEPHLSALLKTNVDEAWVAHWSHLMSLKLEVESRLHVATTLDTTDEAARARHQAFLSEIDEPFQAKQHTLNEKFLASDYRPPNYDVPLRNIQSGVAIFSEDNLPLLTEEADLAKRYAAISAAQAVTWEGETRTVPQMHKVQQDPDRAKREQAWRLVAERQLEDRAALDDLWGVMLALRQKIATNAGFPDDYITYKWQQMNRHDYTPADAARFREAIAEAVVPAATRAYERRRQRLGVQSLRPWDLAVEPTGAPPLRPFETVGELIDTGSTIFHNLDPDLARFYDIMRDEGLLDLDNRQGKAPGGYCTSFVQSQRTFIFMNAIGLHDDVQTLLHESGHAFHAFEAQAVLPYVHQWDVPTEFAEVASMAMELLAAPYLSKDQGGYYDNLVDANRARVEHLEGILMFWPYMAVVDGFQMWAYANPAAATDPARCDAAWAALLERFMPSIDWTGLEDSKVTGWQRKLHIFQVPLYYIEYGLAQLGAVQVWRNGLHDHAKALSDYRAALALGNTATLPDLFATAGAKFQPDADTLAQAVALIEKTITELEATS